ncbi:hypothetical protein [uncultured Arcticibacterium sp.]|mgnify:CR=1 FL=1|uniref:hypothetical protein n=1 Tax=uncultured Arcticibacterium sp. TaxID=2173042 RepID=UPI0030FBAB6A
MINPRLASICFIISGFFLSCDIIPEPQKIEEIVYYNYSGRTIDKIVLDIVSEDLEILGNIEISKVLQPQDSLVFTYNLENSPSTQINRSLRTHVYFGLEPYSFDEIITPYEHGFTGKFDIRREYKQRLFISDTKMLYCINDKKNMECDLNQLSQ